MLLVRACATPQPQSQPRLPKRLARARRVMESKRMDSFRSIHEALKKTAKDEHAFVKDLFVKRSDVFGEAMKDEDDEDAEEALEEKSE